MKTPSGTLTFFTVLCIAVMITAGAAAQSTGPVPAAAAENAAPPAPAPPLPAPVLRAQRPDAFGTATQWTYYQAASFLPWQVPTLPDYFGAGYVTPHDDGTTENPDYWVQLHLPNGALIVDLYANVYDNTSNASWYMWLDIYEHDGTPTFDDITHNVSGDTPGYTKIYLNLPADFVFREWADHDEDGVSGDLTYSVHLNTGGDHADVLTLAFGGVSVGWKRTVSPAPATATFDDVPTGHPFFRFVEALAASGITAGCGGGNYCPDDPVTRGQMAVYLAAALGLHWPT